MSATNAAYDAAIARVRYWFSRGLLDTEKNSTAFFNFIKNHSQLSKVRVSPEVIDTVISLMGPDLDWAQPPAPPAPPPKVFLPDGSEQRPLDEQPNSSWTLAQVKDWSKRDRARKNPPASQPTVRTLQDGRPELPLNADNQTMLKASVAQLRDLSARRNEGGNSWGARMADVVRR